MTNKPLALGIIGYPIGHTLSPMMQSIAARKNGIDLSYGAFEVTPDNLRLAVESLKILSIDGVNVTVPHKVAIVDHLDELDSSAIMVGAVNTIVNRDGRLTGYNTDAYGFITPLKKERSLAGATVLVYGAGGAARAVLAGLLDEGVFRVTVTNRTGARAEELTRLFAAKFPNVHIDVVEYGSNKLYDLLGEADIIVNTSSVGMQGTDPEVVLPGIDHISARALAVDIVYRPLKTNFLKTARSRGAQTIDGLWMLVYQGARAFTLFTGAEFPVDLIRKELEVSVVDS